MKLWTDWDIQPHAEITKDNDGTVHAKAPNCHLVILPDGKAKAFNRNKVKQAIGGSKLHMTLRHLADKVAQGEYSTEQGWDELKLLVENQFYPKQERWIVGELDGVRVYIQNNTIILTKKDLN